jgi:hypothetical protein
MEIIIEYFDFLMSVGLSGAGLAFLYSKHVASIVPTATDVGMVGLILKNITFILSAIAAAIATSAVALYRLSGLEARHKTLQKEVTDEFISMRESQRAQDIEHKKEINRLENDRSTDKLEIQKSLHAFHIESLKLRGPN